MRLPRKLCAAGLSTLALALPAFAGDMSAGITGGVTTGGGAALNSAAEVLLCLLQRLLALF
jgi:hypothetical protein